MADRNQQYQDPQSALKHLQRTLGPDAWRLTPATMASVISGGRWVAVKHLLFIAGVIAKAVNEGEKRIIVTVPPRHGKSELLSVYTPVWMFDRDPTASIILTSYGAELATDFSRRVRDILQHPPIKLRARVPTDVGQVGRFHTTDGGAMYAVGVGGSILGRGADLLLVDDFIKNAKEAMSQATRQAHYDWFVSTALTRVEPGGTVIILAQRWDVDDLIGRLLVDDPHNHWTEIRLPAIAEANDAIGRAEGEALWPERRDVDALMKIKASVGEYFWSALFQQRPVPRSSGLVDLSKLRIVDIVPRHSALKELRSWDLAATVEEGDFTVGGKLIYDLNTKKNYFADVRRGRYGSSQVEQLMRAVAVDDGHHIPIVLEQEPGASGKAYASYLKHEVLKGFTVSIRLSSGSKFLRAQPLYAGITRGEVNLEKGQWNGTTLGELEVFPEGQHDDIVDMMSLAWNEMHRPNAGGLTWSGSNLPDIPQIYSGIGM